MAGLLSLRYQHSLHRASLCTFDASYKAEVIAALETLARAARSQVTFTVVDFIAGREVARASSSLYVQPKKKGR